MRLKTEAIIVVSENNTLITVNTIKNEKTLKLASIIYNYFKEYHSVDVKVKAEDTLINQLGLLIDIFYNINYDTDSVLEDLNKLLVGNGLNKLLYKRSMFGIVNSGSLEKVLESTYIEQHPF